MRIIFPVRQSPRLDLDNWARGSVQMRSSSVNICICQSFLHEVAFDHSGDMIVDPDSEIFIMSIDASPRGSHQGLMHLD